MIFKTVFSLNWGASISIFNVNQIYNVFMNHTQSILFRIFFHKLINPRYAVIFLSKAF